jgi:hypothetical protein
LQSKIFSLQRFEDSFFRLLSIQNELRTKVYSNHGQIGLPFHTYQANLEDALFEGTDGDLSADQLVLKVKSWSQYFTGINDFISLYKTYTISVREIVSQSELTVAEKIKYLDLLEAQMSDPELGVFVYFSVLDVADSLVFRNAGLYSENNLLQRIDSRSIKAFRSIGLQQDLAVSPQTVLGSRRFKLSPIVPRQNTDLP